MAVDKRFWSGAIIVATVAISGAGALPALLLRPAAPEPAPFETAVAKAADLETAVPPASPAPAPEPVAPVAPAPPALPQTSEPPEPPRHTVAAEAFPPVQPIDLATRPETEVAAMPAPAQGLAASAKPAAATKTRVARASTHGVKRKRGVRPAAFPIREFLAWRR